MTIIKISKSKLSIFNSVAKQLRAGAVVVYPTDTAYALGCDATNAKAVAEIFKIKGRRASKALPIIVTDARMAKKFFKLTTNNSQLTTRYWPGPLSIVLKAKKGIAARALDHGTAAVRVPASKMARELSRLAGCPLIATSANVSGAPACYSLAAFLRQAQTMKKRPALALDAGALRRRPASTIVKVTDDGSIVILRQGPIKVVSK